MVVSATVVVASAIVVVVVSATVVVVVLVSVVVVVSAMVVVVVSATVVVVVSSDVVVVPLSGGVEVVVVVVTTGAFRSARVDAELAKALQFEGAVAHAALVGVLHPDYDYPSLTKRTALGVNVSVTPGIDNMTSRTLVAKHPSRAALLAVVKAEGLNCDKQVLDNKNLALEELADHILMASYDKGIDLFTMDELGAQVEKECFDMFKKYPGARIRLKAIGGGGGKGQRILGASLLSKKNPTDDEIKKAASTAPELVREVLLEVKANGVGDNKNVLAELNIEQTRHNEIQLRGNGEWAIALGGRDCSLQMHEQKLLEISVTQEALAEEIKKAKKAGLKAQAAARWLT